MLTIEEIILILIPYSEEAAKEGLRAS